MRQGAQLGEAASGSYLVMELLKPDQTQATGLWFSEEAQLPIQVVAGDTQNVPIIPSDVDVAGCTSGMREHVNDVSAVRVLAFGQSRQHL